MDRRCVPFRGVHSGGARPTAAGHETSPPMLRGSIDANATWAGRRFAGDDQSRQLQRLLNEAAGREPAVFVPPGRYIVSNVVAAGARRGLSASPGRRGSSLPATATCSAPTAPRSSRLRGLIIDGGGPAARRLRARRSSISPNRKASRSTNCEITGSSQDRASRSTAAAGRHRADDRQRRARRRHPRDRVDRPVDHRQHRQRLRQWRHPRPSLERGRGRHDRHRQPGRADRAPSNGGTGAERQRHQRLSRPRRHRRQQPHRRLRLHRGPRQLGEQRPDHRQQLPRLRRGRHLSRSSPSPAR